MRRHRTPYRELLLLGAAVVAVVRWFRLPASAATPQRRSGAAAQAALAAQRGPRPPRRAAATASATWCFCRCGSATRCPRGRPRQRPQRVSAPLQTVASSKPCVPGDGSGRKSAYANAAIPGCYKGPYSPLPLLVLLPVLLVLLPVLPALLLLLRRDLFVQQLSRVFVLSALSVPP